MSTLENEIDHQKNIYKCKMVYANFFLLKNYIAKVIEFHPKCQLFERTIFRSDK